MLKKAFAGLALLLFAAAARAQSADGIWYGTLAAGPTPLRLAFTINGTTAKLRSIDQGGMDIAASRVEIKDAAVTLEFSMIGGTLTGSISGNHLDGTWQQNGFSFPLKLDRVEALPQSARPQEPKKPYPYDAEEVTFTNAAAKITLAGTLTKPREGGPFTAVVLISGSGPQDRDETVFGQKPFLVLSDYLTRRGIAVLRVDDRGVGGSTGERDKATSEDYAGDALAAVDYLATRKEIDAKRIGLIGHSEGGMIAPLAANRSSRVAFLVLLAAPGVRGDDLLVLQAKAVARSNGASDEQVAFISRLQRNVMDLVEKTPDEKELRDKLRKLTADTLAELPPEKRAPYGDLDKMIDSQMKQISSPWFRYLLQYDPAPVLRKVRVPVLALNGSKDVQVPPKENLAAIATALRDNKSAKTMELEGLNHLFQTAKTGGVGEYSIIEETFAPKAMEVIADWILALK